MVYTRTCYLRHDTCLQHFQEIGTLSIWKKNCCNGNSWQWNCGSMFSRFVQAEINCKSKIKCSNCWLTEIRWLYNLLMARLIGPNSDKWMFFFFFSLTQLFSQRNPDPSILFTKARVSYPSRSATNPVWPGLCQAWQWLIIYTDKDPVSRLSQCCFLSSLSLLSSPGHPVKSITSMRCLCCQNLTPSVLWSVDASVFTLLAR